MTEGRGQKIKDGSQQIIAQTFDKSIKVASNDASRFTEGTLPNGLAFAENGDILISNFQSPEAGLPMVHWK